MPYPVRKRARTGMYSRSAGPIVRGNAGRSGKSSYPRRWYKYRNSTYGRKFAASVRKVIMRTTETKIKTQSVSGGGGPLGSVFTAGHNTITGVSIWTLADNDVMWPTRGDLDSNRDGDEINAMGIMIRGVLQIPHDRRNTVVKVFYVPFNTKQGDPTVRDQFFINTVGSTQLDPVRTDNFPGSMLLGTYRVRSSDQTTGSEDKTIFVRKWLPFKKKIKFAAASANVPTNLKERGSLLVCAYDSVASVEGSTLVTNMQWSFSLYFKDP